MHTRRLFFWDVSIRNSLRSNKKAKEAIIVRREAHAKYLSSKTTAGWKEYGIARKKVKEVVEKKGTRKDVVNKTK